jgi:hypothetical protein
VNVADGVSMAYASLATGPWTLCILGNRREGGIRSSVTMCLSKFPLSIKAIIPTKNGIREIKQATNLADNPT